MPYDSRATLVSRLTDIRTALAKAREAESYGIGSRKLQRNYQNLLDEEQTVLAKIEAIDRHTDGLANKVTFQRPI